MGFSLGVLALSAWKQQLSRELRTASADQQMQRCLLLERRLQSLEWVPSPYVQDSGRCRREAAERLWQGRRYDEALRLQQELVSAKTVLPGDIKRFQSWKGQLQRRALKAFEAGQIEEAKTLMRLTDPTGGDPGVSAMVDQLQQIWWKNSTDFERAQAMAAKGQWWEALSALNGLSHPHWRQRSLPLRNNVEAALAKIEKQRVDAHGPLPYAIPTKRLDQLVQQRVAAGVPEWQAFSEACRALGGRLVEEGPEATCQR